MALAPTQGLGRRMSRCLIVVADALPSVGGRPAGGCALHRLRTGEVAVADVTTMMPNRVGEETGRKDEAVDLSKVVALEIEKRGGEWDENPGGCERTRSYAEWHRRPKSEINRDRSCLCKPHYEEEKTGKMTETRPDEDKIRCSSIR